MADKNELIRKIIELPPNVLKELLDIYASKEHIAAPTLNKGNIKFKIFELSSNIQRRIQAIKAFASPNSDDKKWVETVSELPKYAYGLTASHSDFVKRCEQIWSAKICGLNDVYKELVIRAFEYLQSSHSHPLLFVGSPGCGKTTAAMVFAEMLTLKSYFINAPSMNSGRGLFGESQSYKDPGCGGVVNAMLKTKSGNPVIIIDEIDKASYNSNGANLQNEALSLLDDSATNFTDNFLSFPINASYCPIILTANDIDCVSQPLIDRCHVIHFPTPSETDIINIVSEQTIPSVKKSLNIKGVEFPNELVYLLVSSMYQNGITSIRQYQTIVESLLSEAFLTALSSEKSCIISEADIRSILNKQSLNKNRTQIGF